MTGFWAFPAFFANLCHKFSLKNSPHKVSLPLVNVKCFMKNKKIYYWPQRVLAILFIFFISLLALDVFDGNMKIWEEIIGFLIHLIPSYLLIFSLIVAWRWQMAGGIFFILLGLGVFIMAWPKLGVINMLIICGIPIVIGILFILENYFYHGKKSK